MAKPPPDIGPIPDKLRAIFNRLTSDFEGERIAAANAWVRACVGEGINPLDLHVLVGSRGDLIERNQALITKLMADAKIYYKDYQEISRMLIDEQVQNSELRAQLKAQKTELDHAKKSQKLSKQQLDAAEREIKHLRTEIDTRNKQRPAPDTDKQSQQEIAALKAKVASLETNDMSQRSRIAELESELAGLRPERDPWQDDVEAYLGNNPGTRHTTFAILDDLIGFAAVDKVAERRLGAIMRAIGGWEDSNNVPVGDGSKDRRRGYIKRSPHHR